MTEPRHCAFYWSTTKGGEPVIINSASDLYAPTKVKTYRTFDTEFEARGFAGAYGGEYKFLPMPKQAKDVRAPQPTMRGQKATSLAHANRVAVIPGHVDDKQDYPLTHFRDVEIIFSGASDGKVSGDVDD